MKRPRNLFDYTLERKTGGSKDRSYNAPKAKKKRRRKQARKSRRNNRKP